MQTFCDMQDIVLPVMQTIGNTQAIVLTAMQTIGDMLERVYLFSRRSLRSRGCFSLGGRGGARKTALALATDKQ